MTTPRTPRRRLAIAALALLPLVLAACGGSDGEDSAPPAASEPNGDEVVIELVAFTPETLTVDAGATVTWHQKDPGAHTVTSGTVKQGGSGVTQEPDGRFESGDIATDDSFEFTFSEAGTYPYFCRLHPATMRGEIQVR